MTDITHEKDLCAQLCEHPEKIEITGKKMISDESYHKVAETFKILGDTTRIRILHALSFQELCVCDISSVIGMNQSAVSHQLRILRNARLVKYRREGKMAWYSLDDRHIFDLLAKGIEHVTSC